MAFKKGNTYAKNNPNVGTKTKYEFAREILNLGLANNLYNERLVAIKNKKVEERTDQELNDFVKPVALKGLPDTVNANFTYEKAFIDLSDDDDQKKTENNQNISLTDESDISAAEVQGNSGGITGS